MGAAALAGGEDRHRLHGGAFRDPVAGRARRGAGAGDIIEPAIAASIVFVAVENFLSRDIGGRWKITFLFGFIHGFGFADALQKLGLPHGPSCRRWPRSTWGVEIGQLALVALIVPVPSAARPRRAPRRSADARPGDRLCRLRLIAALGCWWFVARTVLT